MANWTSTIGNDGVPSRALVKLHTGAYDELVITCPTDMTGKTLTFTARLKPEYCDDPDNPPVLLQKVTPTDVTISTTTVTVKVAKPDVTIAAGDNSDYAYDGVLRETSGALDGKVWAQCGIAVVRQPGVSA